MAAAHPSVAVVLFHPARQAFILVRQFRPAVYVAAAQEAREARVAASVAASAASAAGGSAPKSAGAAAAEEGGGGAALPLSAGFTFELCAGIVDKPGLSLAEIAAEEVGAGPRGFGRRALGCILSWGAGAGRFALQPACVHAEPAPL